MMEADRGHGVCPSICLFPRDDPIPRLSSFVTLAQTTPIPRLHIDFNTEYQALQVQYKYRLSYFSTHCNQLIP